MQVGEPQRINHLCDELAVVVGLVALVEALSKLVELVEKCLGVVVGDLADSVVKRVNDEV